MTLYYEPMGAGAGGAAGNNVPSGNHARISGLSGRPVFPVGTKVWLKKNPSGEQLQVQQLYGTLPWSLSIWDRQGGTLLLEATFGATLPRSPDCSTLTQSFCKSGVEKYYKVEVPADSPTTVADSTTTVIQRGGRAYDIHVVSRTDAPPPDLCFDNHPLNATCLDLAIRDLSGLDLELGVPPACTEGNDRISAKYFSSTTAFEGTVTYVGRDGNRLHFDAGGSRSVYVAPASAIPPPTAGQTFWFAGGGSVQVLRASQQGEVVLATVDFSSNPDTTQTLGIAVAAEADCPYTVDSSGTSILLQRAVFRSTPPVTVRSGEEGAIILGGKSYRATYRDGRATIWP